MKAVILPTAATSDLMPLTSWLPEFLLPVVNKPIVVHLIELLVRHGIKEILLILKHMPYETEVYFGDGARWGVHLSYSLLSTYRGVADALGRIDSSKLEGSFLCLPADLVTDLDISAFVASHHQGEGRVSLAHESGGANSIEIQPPADDPLSSLGGFPLIGTRESIMHLAKTPTRQDHVLGAGPPGQSLAAHFCKVSGRFQKVQSPANLLAVNRQVLEGFFPGILIPGRALEPGIWSGRRCKIHPGVRWDPPVLIGDHCNIQSSASISAGSVIGNRVLVDEGASVKGSLVLDSTYVGAYANVRDAIVKKNWMLQVPSMLTVHLADDLILGDMEKQPLISTARRMLNGTLALVLLVLTSPLWISLGAYHLARPSKKLVISEKRWSAHGKLDLEGKQIPRFFNLYAFKSKNRLLRKLPGLINVIKGDLDLVGVSPLNEEELEHLADESPQIRAGAPVGLFRLWELESRADLEWEEKMVIENYYAASRSVWGDIKILAKGIIATAFK